MGGVLWVLVLTGALTTGSRALAQEQVSIEIVQPGGPATPAGDNTLVAPQSGFATVATFAADEWTGAGMVSDASIYGRPAAALYGQQTGMGTASISIELSDVPTGDAILTLVGLDDDAPTKTQIALTINQTPVYTGDAWFADWGGKTGEGNWTTVQITIPRGMLGGGVNSITISNTSATGHEGEAPYIVLGAAQILLPGVTVAPIS